MSSGFVPAGAKPADLALGMKPSSESATLLPGGSESKPPRWRVFARAIRASSTTGPLLGQIEGAGATMPGLAHPTAIAIDIPSRASRMVLRYWFAA
jgi:hypothetical protein